MTGKLVSCCLMWLIYSASAQDPRPATNQHPERSTEDCHFPTLSTNGSVDVSTCHFTLNSPANGVYPWQKGIASHSNWLGGPSTDATNSSEGGYVFFDTSSLSAQHLAGFQTKAWLKSPIYQPTASSGNCLRFSYNIEGASASHLKVMRVQMLPAGGHERPITNNIWLPSLPIASVRKRDTTGDREGSSPSILNQTAAKEIIDDVWITSDSTRGQWRKAHVTYNSPHPHGFVFETVPDRAHLQYRGHVAVDDVTFTTGPCQNECEFNADFCRWSNSVDDDFDWTLSRGSLWTHTGPIKDELASKNNFNFGGYAHIDSGHPHYSGSKAKLTSDVIPASDPYTHSALCFTFWAHMFGQDIGQLRMLQKDVGSGIQREIWSLSERSTRDDWLRGQVTLTSATPFQIEFEATVGESGYSDMGIDSFRLEDGPCPALPEGSVKDSLDCTFDNGPCQWIVTNNRPGLTPLWARSSGNVFAGMPNGHFQQNVAASTGNHYFLFDTFQNGHRSGARGFLSHALTADPGAHCLSFWVYMASSSTSLPRLGALQVTLFQPNRSSVLEGYSEMISTTLWRMDNHREAKWRYAQASLTAVTGGYVSFVGIRGDGIQGIIAIDDVALHRGSCPVTPAEAAVNPLDCSFDLNLCNWMVDSKPFIQTTFDDVTSNTNSSPTASPTTTSSEIDIEGLNSTTASGPSPSTALPTEVDMGVISTTTSASVTTALPAKADSEGLITKTTSSPSSTAAVPTETESELVGITASEAADTTEMTPDSSMDLREREIEVTTDYLITSESPQLSSTLAVVSNTPPIARSKTLLERTGDPIKGVYDEVSSFGLNTIEVISTSRNGGSKSIIIRQPLHNNRRSRRGNEWIGYNHPRQSRILRRGNGHSSDGVASRDEVIWRNPAPRWLPKTAAPVPRRPDGPIHGRNFLYGQSLQATAHSKPSTDFYSAPATSSRRNTSRWNLSGTQSLHRIRDHTFQLSAGGYVFFESVDGISTQTRLFSPEFRSNSTYCLSFFFAMVYSDPNTILTVYRQKAGEANAEQLWKFKSSPPRDLSVTKYKSWLPARIPIPSNEGEFQAVIIEGSSDIGGIAIDDIHLRQINCSAHPDEAHVSPSEN